MTKAIDAAARVFNMIDNNKNSELIFQKAIAKNENKDFTKDGEIEINDLKFHYVSRPDAAIFTGLKLLIKPRCITSIVGKSGSGKSTLLGIYLCIYVSKFLYI